MFIPEINSTVCYHSLVAIKLKISCIYVFVIKSIKKVRICNRWFQFVQRNRMQILADFICLHIQISKKSDQFITFWFFKNTKYFQFFFCYLFFCLFLRQKGDINVNPGLKKTTVREHFSCCHWNVNSLAVHNFKKFHYLKHIMLFTIKTWIVVQKYILTVQYQIMKKIF